MFIELHELSDDNPVILINTSAIEAIWERETDEDENDGLGGTVILLKSDSGRVRVSESYETVKALILGKEVCL